MSSLNKKVKLVTGNGTIIATMAELIAGTFKNDEIKALNVCLLDYKEGAYENDVFFLNLRDLADGDGFYQSNLGKHMKDMGVNYVEVLLKGSEFDMSCNYVVKFKYEATDIRYFTENNYSEVFDAEKYVYVEEFDTPYESINFNEGSSFIKYLMSKGAKAYE